MPGGSAGIVLGGAAGGAGRAPPGQGDRVLLSGGPLPVVPAAVSETLERRASVEQRKRRILQGNFVVAILFLLTAYSRKIHQLPNQTIKRKSSFKQLCIITIPEWQMHLFGILHVMLATFLLLLYFPVLDFYIKFTF